LDAQFVLHMPVAGSACAERKPHVKGPTKLFEGVLCLRLDEDNAEGGDLVLHRIHDGIRPRFGARMQIQPNTVSPAKIIPRRRNTLVLWLNTPRSITELTPRATTPFPSIYFNILAEYPRNLFRLPGVHWGGGLAQAWRSIRGQ
jgi:hypothetical protein